MSLSRRVGKVRGGTHTGVGIGRKDEGEFASLKHDGRALAVSWRGGYECETNTSGRRSWALAHTSCLVVACLHLGGSVEEKSHVRALAPAVLAIPHKGNLCPRINRIDVRRSRTRAVSTIAREDDVCLNVRVKQRWSRALTKE